METAMEPRNATETLTSYGQDTGDFGPETDVDTPDEPIGLIKPKGMLIKPTFFNYLLKCRLQTKKIARDKFSVSKILITVHLLKLCSAISK